MPKYIFSCTNCDSEITAYVASTVIEQTCQKCLAKMERKLPNIEGNTDVREVVDPLTNRKWSKDHQQIMKDRRETHYWEVEVPRLVEKYSLETCLEQGWLVYNDKGELVINKSPSKR